MKIVLLANNIISWLDSNADTIVELSGPRCSWIVSRERPEPHLAVLDLVTFEWHAQAAQYRELREIPITVSAHTPLRLTAKVAAISFLTEQKVRV